MKKIFQKLTGLSVLATALVSTSVSAAPLSVQQYNGKSYYLTGASVEIATWKYGALGVYTTIHDDWGSPGLGGVYKNLDTVNTNRGLITSTAAISGDCDENDVNLGKEFIRHGHEVHSHSVTHTQGMHRHEIFNSKAELEQKFGVPVEFYVFPYDLWADSSIQSLKDAGYIGARSGNRYPRIDEGKMTGTIPNMTNDANFADPFALQFDVFPRSNSAYKTLPDNGDKTAFLKRYIKDAVDSKGWAIQEFHDVPDTLNQNTLSIPLNEYQSLLDSVASCKNRNEIWSSGPTDVIRYRFTREYAGQPSLQSSANGYELSFAAPADAAKLNKYNTAITVFFRAPAMTAHISAVQNGVEVPSRKVSDGYFSVDADPTKGSVAITAAAKPYAPYPFFDVMDTTPSEFPEWTSYVEYGSQDQVYYNGAIWKAKHWTQNNEPSPSSPWVQVSDISDVRVFNARASKGGTISPSGKEYATVGASRTYTITAEPGYDLDYVNVNG
ncbi:MAG: polysaccharide deacetylase family protein, partial [Desulfobacterales bacterium]|nr:polysaccharide deacetylase family protein [Desulfobacterales bacterium]